jgi:hypothetical protein
MEFVSDEAMRRCRFVSTNSYQRKKFNLPLPIHPDLSRVEVVTMIEVVVVVKAAGQKIVNQLDPKSTAVSRVGQKVGCYICLSTTVS